LFKKRVANSTLNEGCLSNEELKRQLNTDCMEIIFHYARETINSLVIIVTAKKLKFVKLQHIKLK
jgi:preprotein translocase subunit SecB